MNISEHISSGLLESYVLGLTTADENKFVQTLLQQNSEVEKEIIAIEESLLAYASQQVAAPAAHIKVELMKQINNSSAAKIITQIGSHEYFAYDLTCGEKLSFQEMATELSVGLGEKITFKSPNLFRFFMRKRKEGVAFGYILVLIMLHYLPRFQDIPPISDWVKKISGDKPITFNQFINDYRQALLKP